MYLSIKPSRSSQGWVNSMGPVCCSNNNKLPTGFQTIKKSKKLSYNPILLIIVSSLWTQGIKFINKQDTWAVL